jgi:hypothetical protein
MLSCSSLDTQKDSATQRANQAHQQKKTNAAASSLINYISRYVEAPAMVLAFFTLLHSAVVSSYTKLTRTFRKSLLNNEFHLVANLKYSS